MAATVSALRVVAPVARVAARKATAARTALVVKPARVSVRVSASEGDVGERLSEALKIAEECVDECAAMWDEVEELSQAASDKKPAPEELEPAPISQADMDFIKATQAALADAKKGAGEVDMDTLRALETASASAKKVTVSSDRLKALEAALEAALASAKECTGDDCAVEWEAVEEISAAKSRAENTD